jgi:NAD(P)-dependent dehydrogenase (short-subunit alcohol dehydrogenase family)
MYRLKDKAIVVIGAAGLLGRNFVNTLAEHGADVIAADSDEQACQTVVDEIGAKFEGRVTGMHVDISDRGSVEKLLGGLCGQHKHVDAVVNCAYPRTPNYGRELEYVDYEDFCHNINIHLGGYFLVMQQFSLLFRGQGWGNIVNISSIYGTMVPRFEIYRNTNMTMPVEYAAIKSALIQLTKYFAQYFKGYNIRVNCLSPGGVLNKQPDVFVAAYNRFCNGKGLLDPCDINGTLLFLLSEESRYITGQNIIIDDGFQL